MSMKVAKCNKLAKAKHNKVVEEDFAHWHDDQENNAMVNEMAG